MLLLNMSDPSKYCAVTKLMASYCRLVHAAVIERCIFDKTVKSK